MKRQQAGFALMLVIWSLIVLAGMATGFAYAVRHETRVAADLASRARAEAAGAGALSYSVIALSRTDEETRWHADGAEHEIPWPEATIIVRVTSESGRIDLNRAPRELFIGLFEQLLVGADHAALADALVDWRDRDDEPGDSGAEEREYRRAGYAYIPPNRPYNSVNELSQVLGFNREIVDSLAPYLTIYSRVPRVNAVSADTIVLAAVPQISRSEAEAFVQYREEALAAGQKLRFDELRNGRRYLDMRVDDRVYSVDADIVLADGFHHQEHTVIQIVRSRGYQVWLREVLPATPSEESTAGTPEESLGGSSE